MGGCISSTRQLPLPANLILQDYLSNALGIEMHLSEQTLSYLADKCAMNFDAFIQWLDFLKSVLVTSKAFASHHIEAIVSAMYDDEISLKLEDFDTWLNDSS